MKIRSRTMLSVILLFCVLPVPGASETSGFDEKYAGAEAAARSGDREGSISLYRESLELAETGTQTGRARHQIALAYRRMGRHEDAIKEFRKIFDIEGDSRAWHNLPHAQVHIGLSYKDMGEYERAVDEFSKIMDVTSHEVFIGRAFLETALCYEALAGRDGITAEKKADYEKLAIEAYIAVLKKTADDGYIDYLRRAYGKIGPDHFETEEKYMELLQDFAERLTRNARLRSDEDMGFLAEVIEAAGMD